MPLSPATIMVCALRLPTGKREHRYAAASPEAALRSRLAARFIKCAFLLPPRRNVRSRRCSNRFGPCTAFTGQLEQFGGLPDIVFHHLHDEIVQGKLAVRAKRAAAAVGFAIRSAQSRDIAKAKLKKFV